MTVKEKITLPKNLRISVSKEDNKFSALVRMLRMPQYKNIGPTIIFCNLKKNVDKITSLLNQSGISASSYHSGKSDVERQMIQVNFMNDKTKIIVSTVAFAIGISKLDVRLVVLFDMPPSIELFLQQAGRGGRDKKETLVHTFLHDEDYFVQRNITYMDNIENLQIKKMMDYIYTLIDTNLYKPKKRNYEALASPNSKNKFIDEEAKELSLPKTVAFNFTSATDFCGIKKQILLYLLLNLVNSPDLNSTFESTEKVENNADNNSTNPTNDKIKIRCLGVGPSSFNLRFYKTSPEVLADREPNIRTIIEHSRDYQGFIKFNTLEVCEKIGTTYNDLINYLFQLQAKGEIGYESKDECIFFVIEKYPNSISQIMEFLFEKANYLLNLNLTKLNACYTLLRKFATVSIDPFVNIKNDKNVPIKCMNSYTDFYQYENEFRLLFEKYFITDERK